MTNYATCLGFFLQDEWYFLFFRADHTAEGPSEPRFLIHNTNTSCKERKHRKEPAALSYGWLLIYMCWFVYLNFSIITSTSRSLFLVRFFQRLYNCGHHCHYHHKERDPKLNAESVLTHVGDVELFGNLPFCGGGSTCRVNVIKIADGTFFPGNRQGGP